MLTNKKIIVGVTGGIAAYKTAELLRQLREQHAIVRVVMTSAAKEFITPITLQAISGHPVHDELLSREAEMAMGHIELARWADLIMIAPASADVIARLAHGHANDLLTTLCLATKAPIAIAPAMNVHMWENVATQANVATLTQRKIHIIGPTVGSQACGDIGYGRMSEPAEIVNFMIQQFQKKYLAGQRVLITAGPTREAIDPVRFITNHSSGKMGYAIAQACREAGAEVTLISGPVHIPIPVNVNLIPVITAQQMYEMVMQQATDCDIFIGAAAVADYRCAEASPHKIKKSTEQLSLHLIKNIDILTAVASLAKRPFVIGFAAETENIITNAKQKLMNKRLDLVVANHVGDGKGFHMDEHNLIVIDKQANQYDLGQADKLALARRLVEVIAEKR